MNPLWMYASAAFVGVWSPLAMAAYPEKPIEIIVPWPAGIEADISARAISSVMSKKLGVPVQVINKPGAQGVIGTSEVARAKPDGYSIGSLNIAALVAQPIAGNATYKPADFEPIGLYSAVTMVLTTRKDAGLADLKAFEVSAKSASKPPIFGSYGPASYPAIMVHRMSTQNGWPYKAVTFPSPGFVQLESRDADFVVAPYSVVASSLKAGQIIPLVALTKDRIAELPNVPTLREAGYNFDSLLWSGLFAPKGTPKEVMDKLTAALKEAVQDPSIKELSRRINSPFFFVDPQQAKAQIAADEAAMKPVMDSLGLVKK
ncbi:tripartite tricarboxylate transporter substrate binding protein [Variovorax sp. J31P179]|uniref:Bug family tripartite tricarboxylate transporter substrate binding protein n=1 Tax=Variovorax sp. J31P179 TaxID=3053508 RepID=UPI0025762E88|nr:tripartite tricarboxylate transporter substrate binding protein [Variovorax sp. J31P179]MDM0084717.1 tripartite tricarboxylate transporter substrate binding protein [Variovorax sp. J31P179]